MTYLKAIMQNQGCGKIAAILIVYILTKMNRLVKSFVYEKLKANKYQLAVVKRYIKNKPPYAIPINRTWGVDLTTVNLSTK